MSSNPHRSTKPGDEPPRPQVKYSLATLGLAQSTNNGQGLKGHAVPGASAPAPTTSTSKAVSPFGPTASSSKQTATLSYAAVASGNTAARGGTKATVTPSSTTSTAALLAVLNIGGSDRTPANADMKASSPLTSAPKARYTASTSLAQTPADTADPAGTAATVSPPASQSFPSINTVVPPPQASVTQPLGQPYSGPVPFSTATRFPAKVPSFPQAPAHSGEALSFGGVQSSDPSRYPMPTMPMSGALSPPMQHPQQPLPPQPSQLQQQQRYQQQQVQPGVSPYAQQVPQIPQPRGADTAYARSAYASPFQQTVPLDPQQQQQQSQQSSLSSSVARGNPSGAPTPPQPGRTFYPQQQLRQPQMQQPQAYQARPQQNSNFAAAPHAQRDSRTSPNLAALDQRPPLQQPSQSSPAPHVPMYTALPPGFTPPPPSSAPAPASTQAVQQLTQMNPQVRPYPSQMQSPYFARQQQHQPQQQQPQQQQHQPQQQQQQLQQHQPQ
ncbi:hypothetical protein ABL78_7142, partial [Leptomonas seymouri]